ncbi:MAG: dimethyl sulfoxide reductase anchor subunit [Planctomycetales bacterium]
MATTIDPPVQTPSLQGLLDDLLKEQQATSAVDQFARFHESREAIEETDGVGLYRELIPVGTPAEGEQFAFEVDLDACSGCKACVAACHNLNGLEEEELWRGVGLLTGGDEDQPVLQHVTAACHHCLEPACMHGCPVEAYEKDPITGIVSHLDDQCIGCRYCLLTCPYDAPVYSHSKGVVRKCDMCRHRLAVGEAPACVQSCPNEAIRIRVVRQEAVREECETHSFPPAGPDSDRTLPTTHYKTKRPMPGNMLPADYFSVQCAEGHPPLTLMLILTQASAGAFLVEHAMYSYFSVARADVADAVRPFHLCAALLLGGLGLAASIFHLGRPLHAYRALLGLRTSWLSREILAFGVFAAAATAYVGAASLDWFGGSSWAVSASQQAALGAGAALAGLAAIFCSVMVYVATRRPTWTFLPTAAKFLLTAGILGVPTALLVSLAAAATHHDLTVRAVMDEYGETLCRVVIALVIAKLLLELSVFAHLRSRRHTPLKRAALLLSGELSMTVLRRFFFGIIGGLALPGVLLGESTLAPTGFQPPFIAAAVALMLGMLAAGEFLERDLFFRASVAPKMPGDPAS